MAERTNCGKEGRIARAVIRGADAYMSKETAIDHIENCPKCLERIMDSLENNPDTKYKGNTLANILFNLRESMKPAYLRDLRGH